MTPSSFTVFARKVKGSKWSERMIRRSRMRQVEKEDYVKSERPQILKHLYKLALLSTK